MTTAERSCDLPVAARSTSDQPLSIEDLPDEILQLIVCYLPTPTLKNTALASKCLYRHATDMLWQNVCLVDTWKLHMTEQGRHLRGDRGLGEPDEHDDTPVIQKLYILATNPALASKVQFLTTRCHLPTPNIFNELPHMYFHAENLSQDIRLRILLLLAIQNMINVHTLRIVYGHWKFIRTLLNGFLDPKRPCRIPLRRLWLESCSLLGLGAGLLSSDYCTGLESIRIRRLRAETTESDERSHMRFMEFRLSRGGQLAQLHDAAGGWFMSTAELSREPPPPHWGPRFSPAQLTTAELAAKAHEFDECIWHDLPDVQEFVDANQMELQMNHQFAPAEPMLWLMERSSSTLTSLNLDWILWRQKEPDTDTPALTSIQTLARLRFPHLRAFQMRNAVVSQTMLPNGIYLLEDTFLEFMEAHPKLQCLAWPLDRFYSHAKPSTQLQNRTRQIVARLGNVLVDLRVDNYYNHNGETFTDESKVVDEQQERIRRRRFIAEFAPYMSKVKQLKLEGGIPRDEKREIIRALHFCPLEKIVFIGVTFPIGNTWGPRGEDLKALDPGQASDATYNLEEEDVEALRHHSDRWTRPPTDFKFEPYYGWCNEPPFLHTIALHHASAVTELKLCGYNGSPILSHATPITHPLLFHLRYFHNLRQLVVSFWLLTYFEDGYRDSEIIQSWMDTRSPASTALVVVTPPLSPVVPPPVDPTPMPIHINAAARPQEFNRWAVALKTCYAPSALAYRVARDIAPHLSPVAKDRPGGVRVRASFCLGTKSTSGRTATDIFDLDIRIGRDDQVLEFVGPREEAERGRFWQKLEGRQWF